MKENLKILIIGFFAGVISGFFGAGGGLLLIPFFTKFLKMGSKTARATAITIVLFLVISSSFFYFKVGNVDLKTSAFCAIGGILGSYIGSKLLIKFSSKFLNIIFIVFLIYSGLRMMGIF